MFNKIILVGNLTRDIELRYSQGGMGIAKTAIATSRKFTSNGEKKEEVCFVDITFFGRSAEVANQYLRKGSKILVEGRLNFEQWVDQNGQKRSKHSVIVETMQMLDSRGDNQGGGYNAPMGGQAPMNDNASMGGGYNAPTQGEAQSYQQPSYQQPQQQQQQSYQQPQPSYNNNQAQAQSREMPSAAAIPEIDIDEDEIPF
jgi:single-strand DNA-binding protein